MGVHGSAGRLVDQLLVLASQPEGRKTQQVGAHTFVQQVVFENTDGFFSKSQFVRGTTAHKRRRRCFTTQQGSGVDAVLETWARGYHAADGGALVGAHQACSPSIVEQKERVALRVGKGLVAHLEAHGFVPLATQLCVASARLGCAPVLDLVGHWSTDPQAVAVIEVKVGSAVMSPTTRNGASKKTASASCLQDTPRNRCMAQLALQVLCVEEAARRLHRKAVAGCNPWKLAAGTKKDHALHAAGPCAVSGYLLHAVEERCNNSGDYALHVRLLKLSDTVQAAVRRRCDEHIAGLSCA